MSCFTNVTMSTSLPRLSIGPTLSPHSRVQAWRLSCVQRRSAVDNGYGPVFGADHLTGRVNVSHYSALKLALRFPHDQAAKRSSSASMDAAALCSALLIG